MTPPPFLPCPAGCRGTVPRQQMTLHLIHKHRWVKAELEAYWKARAKAEAQT